MISDSQNKGVHPLAYTRLTAINVMFALVFGMNGCRSVEDPLYEKMVHCIEKNSEFLSITADLSAYFPILSFLDVIFKKERNMKHFVEKECRPFYKELIELARKVDQPSLIKNLDKIKTSLDIDEQNIIALTTEFMIAGVDTVSVSLEWAMAVLCHYPEWQKRISDEVDLFIEKNGRLPFFSDRNDFPNLTAVIKEILRYRPSVHLGVPHKANEDIVYKDYVIPKGTLLMSNNHTTNNDPKYFEEPEKFKPERYLKDSRSVYASSNGNIHSRELFTFGWGRRICPGIYLAEGEMFGWLTQLLSKCTIEPIISGNEAIYPEIQDCRAVDATISPLPYKYQDTCEFVETVIRRLLKY
ncbi:hypothetical protein G6F56_009750 [Rhizopus delemar]|nr:hypothetical protein G6F56_009750 [Rhizopus delemar]